MSPLTCRLLCNVQRPNPPLLERLGDAALTPVRYFFHGRRVEIRATGAVHHVASFHPRGEEHVSRTDPTLTSSSQSSFKTVLMLIGLIPGLFIGAIARMMSFWTSGGKHIEQVVAVMTPGDVSMEWCWAAGMNKTNEERVSDIADSLNQYIQTPKKIDVFTLPIDLAKLGGYRVWNLIERLNPKKIVFVGGPLGNSVDYPAVYDVLTHSEKWRSARSDGQRHYEGQPMTFAQKEIRSWVVLNR